MNRGAALLVAVLLVLAGCSGPTTTPTATEPSTTSGGTTPLAPA